MARTRRSGRRRGLRARLGGGVARIRAGGGLSRRAQQSSPQSMPRKV